MRLLLLLLLTVAVTACCLVPLRPSPLGRPPMPRMMPRVMPVWRVA